MLRSSDGPLEARALVLVVADHDGLGAVLADAVVEWGYRGEHVDDPERALDAVGRTPTDLIVVDDAIGELDALELCRAVQDAGAWAPPVLVIASRDQASTRIAAFDAGATDVLVQPFDPLELRARMRAALRLKATRDALAAEAETDPLTGLYNRARLDLLAGESVATSRRSGRPLSCAAVDVDGFKGVNDAFGHAAGDEVLREVARRLRAASRMSDEGFRIGGDELLVLLPDTDLDGAVAFAEKLRRLIASAPVTARCQGEPALVPVTVSIGVAQLGHDADTHAVMLEDADAALYEAKRCGRNRVEVPRSGPVSAVG